jgi:Holliday junction resolvase RusA-like endonuclease
MLLEKLLQPEWVDETFRINLSFILKGKARPRFDPRSGHVYMPEDYMTHVESLQWMLRSLIFNRLSLFSANKAYAVEIAMKRKRRKPKSKKDAVELERNNPYGWFAQGKPDWDNAAGTLCDACNKIIYGDDAQVVMGLAYRVYASEPGAQILIVKLKDYVDIKGVKDGLLCGGS